MIEYKREHYRIIIDEQKGEIVSLNKDNEEILGSVKLPLFVIQFRDTEGNKQKFNVYDGKLIEANRTGIKLILRYSEFAGANFVVTLSAAFSEQISWRVSVQNNTSYVIEWIDLPQIAARNELPYKGGNKKLLWGFNEGAIVEDLSLKEALDTFKYRDPDYPQEGTMCVYPGIVETQFMAYYGENGGLYLGTHDNKGNVKGIDFEPIDDCIRLRFRLFSGLDFGDDFEMDYDFVMQCFKGDWYNAADIYRNWFEENKPDDFVKATVNPKLPEWYFDSPIVITYPVRGVHDTDTMTPNRMYPYINAMKHVERLSKEIDSRIMVILMHWEGTAPWAPPYVWPPFGGEEEIEKFITALHKENHIFGVYCSGLGWTMQSNLIDEYNKSKEFEDVNLKSAMCLAPDGSLPPSKICTPQRSGYDMCPTQEFTKEVIYNEVKSMVEADIDYIQVLDQNHGGTPYFCYSKEHGHPPVPGQWQVTAMKELLENLERATHNNGRKVLLGCESAAGESYIPNLAFSDNRFNLNYRIGSFTVPVYSYIFHEYVTNFMGNQVCGDCSFNHVKNPENLLFRIAYSFTAGDIMTLVLDQDGNITWNWGLRDNIPLPKHESIITYIKNANALRKGDAKKFFVGGKMIKPLTIKCEGYNEMVLEGGYKYNAPKLLASAWCAEDGSLGQIITNYNDYSVDFAIVDDGRFELEGNIPQTVAPFETILIKISNERK